MARAQVPLYRRQVLQMFGRLQLDALGLAAGIANPHWMERESLVERLIVSYPADEIERQILSKLQRARG